jgi:hypothetical protein
VSWRGPCSTTHYWQTGPRSALVEAVELLTQALNQIAALPATPPLRREQITLQVALIHPLMHVEGYTAPETTAAAKRARLLIEQAEALGEPPDDPLLVFSVPYSFVDTVGRNFQEKAWALSAATLN